MTIQKSADNIDRYWYSFDDQMHEMFGGKVSRLALSAARTCPNRDGTRGSGGCIFCSAGGSGDFAESAENPASVQIRQAKARVESKIGRRANFAGYMAYFQSFTGTYGDTETLGKYYREALEQPEIAALSIGTRPDCLGGEMLSLLAELNRKKPVFVELGLQTIHEDTARYINRCYELPVFEDAFLRLKRAGLKAVVHVIIGLPGEDRERTIQTVRYLSELRAADGTPVDGIKLQLLHVLKGTRLAELLPEEYTTGKNEIQNAGGDIILRDGMILPQYTLAEYAELLTELVGMLPEKTAVHRMTGDAPGNLLLLPIWTRDKKKVLNTIRSTFREKWKQISEV